MQFLIYKLLCKLNCLSNFLKHQFKLYKLAFTASLLIIFFATNAQQSNNSKQNHSKISPAVKKIESLQIQSLNISAYNMDSAMLLAKMALKMSEEIKNDSGFANAYLALGWYYYYSGNRDSAEYFLLKSIELCRKVNMPVFEGKCLINLSYVYQDGEEYIKLIDCLKRARPLIEKTKDEIALSTIDLTMGSTYGDMQMYEQGKRYIYSAIVEAKKLNRKDMLTGCYSAYGYIFVQEGNFDSALYYYRLNYALTTELEDVEGKGIATDNLGEAFQKKAIKLNCKTCIDSAFQYYKLALYWFTKMNSDGYIKYAKMNLGGVLRIKKDYKQAEDFLIEAFQYFDSTNDIKYAYNSSQLLSMLYKDVGNYEQAYNYNIISQEYSDSLNNKKRADSISKMFALYETEKRDRTIQLLNTKAALDKEEISRQHMIELFAVISIVLIAILFVVLINRSRIKQQLKEVKVRNQLAADLHDEVGSSLSSILLLSKMAASKKTVEENNNSMLEKISANTKEVIDKMGDIVWMMNPKYDEGENVREKLEQYVSRIKDVAPFKIHLEIDDAIDTIKFTNGNKKSHISYF